MAFNKEKILFYFFIFIFLETLSFFTWQMPDLNLIIFPIIILGTWFLTWHNLNHGLLLASGELLIGSFGHLFNFSIFDQTVSWRMFIWLIILVIWFKEFLINYKKIILVFKKNKTIIISFFILIFFIIFSFIQGIINNNLIDVFLDSNAWFYLLLFLPWLMFDYKYFNDLWQIVLAAICWLFVKTSLLLYFFSHNFLVINSSLYHWIRDFRLGEITFASGNFWRVFLQSQIFSLFLTIVLIYLAWCWYKNKKNYQNFWYINFFIILSLSVVLMSYSRSFWLGLFGGLFICLIYIFYKYKKESWKKIIIFNLNLIFIFFLTFVLIFLIVKFPWPKIDVSKTDLFISRLQNPAIEAAGSSRLNQLKPLFTAIKQDPLLGHGFGTRVVYQSTDPRILSLGNDYAANYSTYAFEWGYLDIWLKVGLIGLSAYFLFIYLVIKKVLLLKFEPLTIAFVFGYIGILITNFTTPYLNHPLGIGIIFWLIAISNKNETT